MTTHDLVKKFICKEIEQLMFWLSFQLAEDRFSLLNDLVCLVAFVYPDLPIHVPAERK